MAWLRLSAPSKRMGKASGCRTNFSRRLHTPWRRAPNRSQLAEPEPGDVTWVTLAEVGTNVTLPERQENQPFARGKLNGSPRRPLVLDAAAIQQNSAGPPFRAGLISSARQP